MGLFYVVGIAEVLNKQWNITRPIPSPHGTCCVGSQCFYSTTLN